MRGLRQWEGIMSETSKQKTEKKRYTKPQVTEVHLVAEEAVLSTCKTVPGNVGACNPPDLSCGSLSSGS